MRKYLYHIIKKLFRKWQISKGAKHLQHCSVFGSDSSTRRGNLQSVSVCSLTLCNRGLRIALKEFLQHSKGCRGVLGQASKHLGKQASKQSSKQARKQGSKQVLGQAGK